MSTLPWAEDTPDLLPGALGHIARAWVSVSGVDDIELDVVDGTLSYDEARTPRVTLDLTCGLLADRAALAQVDPRLPGRRVMLEVGYRRPDGVEDVHTIANLHLRGRSLSYPDNTMRITATSDESKLLDDAPSTGGTITETGAGNAIGAVFGAAGLGYTLFGDATSDLTAFSITPLTDKWDAIEDIADQIGADFYGDGTAENSFRLEYRPTAVGTATHTVTTGNGGTITDGTYSLDRDEFYNRVYLEHEWTDTAGTPKRVAVVRNATGTFAPTSGNVRTLYLRRNTPTDATKAGAAATTLARRQATRGRSINLTAISAYWVRPGQTIAAQLPDIDTERHLVAAVTFRLGDGLMDVTTRLPGE